MEHDLDEIVAELGEVLSSPNSSRREKNEPVKDKKWRAGDLLLGLDKADRDLVADKLDVASSLLKSYAEVAAVFPPHERTIKAAWTVYREMRILSTEQRKALMHDGMTLRQARIAAGKGPMDRPRKDRQTHDERAWFVVEELQDPVIRAIVEREMKEAGADRRARKAAKSTLDEIAARRKFIEGEIRKQQKKGSPERQYWEASRELVDAEHFIHSVAQLYKLHAESITEELWDDIVQKLGHVADSALDVTKIIEGVASADYIEAEVIGHDRALPAGTGDDVVDADVVDD